MKKLPGKNLSLSILTFCAVFLFTNGLVFSDDDPPGTWEFERWIEDPPLATGPYLDAVAGEFLNDDFQALAILEDTSVKVMAAPLVYDPPLFCEVPGTWVALDCLPGRANSGKSDALVVAGPSGLYTVAWDHATTAFVFTEVSTDPDITHICIDDMDGDGNLEIVAASQSMPVGSITIFQEGSPGYWEPICGFNLSGVVQDMDTLKWLTGVERQIAVVREGTLDGLNIFDMEGTSHYYQFKLSLPEHPDSLVRIGSCNSGQDMLAWATGTGNGSSGLNDQVLFIIIDDVEYEMHYMGASDITAMYTMDPDQDTDQDLILLSRTTQPVRLISHEFESP
ncbi:MAG: hypothetical protein ABIK28_02710, partial [Planctomycetota bacterium]